MYELPLEDIHRLIDAVEEAMRKIERARTDSIEVQQVPELSEAILELLGWTNTAYVQNTLGINPSVLNKFVKMRGVIRRSLAAKVADRLRSYLKSEDQPFPVREVKPASPTATKPEVQSPPSSVFKAEQCVAVRTSSTIKMKIGAISALIDSIIIQTKGANEPPELQILTAIERQQLIAILETALNLLKSPLIERSLLEKAQDILSKGAKSAVEKGVQEGLGKLMEGAGSRIAELIGLLFS